MTLGTPANKKAQAAMRDAERRAKRKLNRLRRKGLNVGGISPLKSRVDLSDTRGIKSYTKSLEQFISRQTRYVSADQFSKGYQAGYEGAPISYQAYRKYMAAEKKFNAEMQRRYDEVAAKPYIQSGKVQGTVEQVSVEYRVNREKHAKADVSTVKIKNEADLLRRAEVLTRASSEASRMAGMERYRQHLIEWAREYNNDLEGVAESLTNEQLWELRMTTNFDDAYHMYYPSGGDYADDVSDQLNDATYESMTSTVEAIRKRIPGKRIPVYNSQDETGKRTIKYWQERGKQKAKASRRGKRGKRRK